MYLSDIDLPAIIIVLIISAIYFTLFFTVYRPIVHYTRDEKIDLKCKD